MEHRDWASAEEFLAYVGDLFPFHSNWPDPGPMSVSSAMGDGDTPLHVASAWGNLKAVALLLSADAAVDSRGDMGVTPQAPPCIVVIRESQSCSCVAALTRISSRSSI